MVGDCSWLVAGVFCLLFLWINFLNDPDGCRF